VQPAELNTGKQGIGFIALLSFGLAGFSFWFQGNIGLNLADEGFLWDGTVRTLAGEIPILDFKAYDPGRYYWSAGWALLFGDGIMALRLSVAIFQALGLFMALLAATRVLQHRWQLVLAGFLLLLWMFPRHKLFDLSLSMAAVYVATVLIERPTYGRHFIAGAFVGLAAVFGRNHGVYTFLAFVSVVVFISVKIDRGALVKRLGVLVGGIAVGYAPMLLMIVFIPGYGASVADSVLAIMRHGATNIPLPIPWPWRFSYSQMVFPSVLYAFSMGLLFLLLPLFVVFAVIRLWLTGSDALKSQPLLISSAFVGMFYMHYAFSRADLGHLAHSIHPLILGLIAIPFSFQSPQRKRIVAGAAAITLGLTVFAAVRGSPYFEKYTAKGSSLEFVSYDISGDRMWIRNSQAVFIHNVKQITERLVRRDEGILFAPHIPALYPIVGKMSPVWNSYFLVRETDEVQQKMIRDLGEKNVHWALVSNVIAADDRNDLRFQNTHHLVWQYLLDEFEPVPIDGFLSGHKLYRRKNRE
jgi:hypothetical protein